MDDFEVNHFSSALKEQKSLKHLDLHLPLNSTGKSKSQMDKIVSSLHKMSQLKNLVLDFRGCGEFEKSSGRLLASLQNSFSYLNGFALNLS